MDALSVVNVSNRGDASTFSTSCTLLTRQRPAVISRRHSRLALVKPDASVAADEAIVSLLASWLTTVIARDFVGEGKGGN
jgi:hypothetical protein